MALSGILGKTAAGLGAAAVPMVFAAPEQVTRQQIPASASAALGGTHPHASTGPDGSTGGPALGRRVGRRVGPR